jgi:hypothetical protein
MSAKIICLNEAAYSAQQQRLAAERSRKVWLLLPPYVKHLMRGRFLRYSTETEILRCRGATGFVVGADGVQIPYFGSWSESTAQAVTQGTFFATSSNTQMAPGLFFQDNPHLTEERAKFRWRADYRAKLVRRRQPE